MAINNFKKGKDSLKKYAEAYGNTRVRNQYNDSDGFPLGRWAALVRRNYRRAKVSFEEIRQLENLGFEWWSAEEACKEGLPYLKRFVKTNGHADVPLIYEDDDGFSLGLWAKSMREAFNEGKLLEEKIKELLLLGFDFGTVNSVRSKTS